MENTNSQCPEWCVTAHDELDPAGRGYCDGQYLNLEPLLDRSIGDGTGEADFKRVLSAGVEKFYADLSFNVELLPSEVDAFAQSLISIANEITKFTKEVEATRGN